MDNTYQITANQNDLAMVGTTFIYQGPKSWLNIPNALE